MACLMLDISIFIDMMAGNQLVESDGGNTSEVRLCSARLQARGDRGISRYIYFGFCRHRCGDG